MRFDAERASEMDMASYAGRPEWSSLPLQVVVGIGFQPRPE